MIKKDNREYHERAGSLVKETAHELVWAKFKEGTSRCKYMADNPEVFVHVFCPDSILPPNSISSDGSELNLITEEQWKTSPPLGSWVIPNERLFRVGLIDPLECGNLANVLK